MTDSLHDSHSQSFKSLNLSSTDSWQYEHWSSENIEVLDNLFRSLRRKKGFGLFFVQCSPAQSTSIITAIQGCFPTQKLEKFELNRQSKTLYEKLFEHYQENHYDIACVTGIEQAIYEYEDTKRLTGWTSEEIYTYSWKGTPQLLNHLNQHRENFAENLPIRLIFLVPYFVVDYFVQRAPDFFDWRSGIFKFSEDTEKLKKISQSLIGKTYQDYSQLTSAQRIEKTLEIKELILQLDEDSYQKAELLREQGLLLDSEKEYQKALECYNRALNIQPDNAKIWNNRGLTLKELNRYEEAIDSYDHALKIEPNYYDSWINRGNALHSIKKYKEANASYDKALEIRSRKALSYAKYQDLGRILIAVIKILIAVIKKGVQGRLRFRELSGTTDFWLRHLGFRR